MIDPQLLQQLLQELAAQSRVVIAAVAVATVAVLILIGGAFWFQREYHKVRGAIRGQLDSINELKTIIEEQTKIVKKIESEFDYSTWHAKERNQMLRKKLEELLLSALAVEAYVDGVKSYLVFNDPEPAGPEPQAAFLALQSLYFPDLSTQSTEVFVAAGLALNGCRDAYLHRIEDHRAAVAAGTITGDADWRSVTAPRQVDATNATQLQIALHARVVELRGICGARMSELLAEAAGAKAGGD